MRKSLEKKSDGLLWVGDKFVTTLAPFVIENSRLLSFEVVYRIWKVGLSAWLLLVYLFTMIY